MTPRPNLRFALFRKKEKRNIMNDEEGAMNTVNVL
jgi:hypothetical protein